MDCCDLLWFIVHFIPTLANASYQLCCCEKHVVIQALEALAFGRIQLYFWYKWYKNCKLARFFKIAESGISKVRIKW